MALSPLATQTRWIDAVGQAELVRSGEVTPVELTEAAIERIMALDGALHAVNIRWFDHARAVATGDLPDGAFRGVPFLLKDLWSNYAGQPISNGNKALAAAGYVAPHDTTLVERYRAAGLVMLGRTASPEFGSVPTTEPEAWGATRNPWDTTRTPGGSSGGSAVAVASGMVPVAHASDGGGSIRIPAAACGLVGLKPSQGRITTGPARAESGLGVEHCVSRTVRDTAALLDATHGPGVGDSVIAPVPQRRFIDELGTDPGRLRIGLLDFNPRGLPIDPACADAVRGAAALLESLGHHVEPSYPAPLADASFGVRFGAMWSTNMAGSIKTVSEQLGRDVTADDFELMNWAMATFARNMSAVDYAAALAAVAVFRREVQAWWQHYDILLTPTLGEMPPTLGQFANNPADPSAPSRRSAAFVPFTPAFNASGQPAISLPIHWTAEGLPVGVQLVAAYAREDLLLRLAAQLEVAAPWAHHYARLDRALA